jgi:hypothetical protein
MPFPPAMERLPQDCHCSTTTARHMPSGERCLFRLGESFVVKVTRCALLIAIPPTVIDIFL